MTTGLKNSPGMGTAGKSNYIALPSLAQNLERAAVNMSIVDTGRNIGIAQQLPPVVVPAGCAVTIRGVNATGNNAGVIYVGMSRESVEDAIGRYTITADTEVSFPVDNLSQIWWTAATRGDGITVGIRGAAIH